jgi:protease-4
LVDGLKYDEVKDEIKSRLKLGKDDNINFVAVEKYAKAVNYKSSGKDRIALIYAQGDIVDEKEKRGKLKQYLSQPDQEGQEDKNVKAIVLRINPGGGSSLASETSERNDVARKEKPVVVSFGDGLPRVLIIFLQCR